MNYARHHHSGCTMSDYVYVFCGSSGISSNLNSIERLNVTELISGASICRWHTVPNNSFGYKLAPSDPIVAPISSTEIIILGGY